MNIKYGRLRAQLLDLSRTAPAAAKAIAVELAAQAVSEGKRGIVPKITGNLRSTLRVENAEGLSVKFVAGGQVGRPTRQKVKPVYVNYAFYVNVGTSKFPGRFYMERSVAAAVAKKNVIYQKAIRSWLAYST